MSKDSSEEKLLTAEDFSKYLDSLPNKRVNDDGSSEVEIKLSDDATATFFNSTPMFRDRYEQP